MSGYTQVFTHLLVGVLVAPPSDCPIGPPVARIVQVRFFNQSRLSENHLRTIAEIANRIWQPNGIAIKTVSDSDGINVVVSGDRPGARSEEAAAVVIGTTMFSNGHATSNIRLSLGAAEALAHWFEDRDHPLGGHPTTAVDVTVLRVLGVALAHEIAHYLLDTPEHSSEGLLRPRFSLNEMVLASPARFSLTCGQRRVLLERTDR